jgi:hypothetical protein
MKMLLTTFCFLLVSCVTSPPPPCPVAKERVIYKDVGVMEPCPTHEPLKGAQ